MAQESGIRKLIRFILMLSLGISLICVSKADDDSANSDRKKKIYLGKIEPKEAEEAFLKKVRTTGNFEVVNSLKGADFTGHIKLFCASTTLDWSRNIAWVSCSNELLICPRDDQSSLLWSSNVYGYFPRSFGFLRKPPYGKMARRLLEDVEPLDEEKAKIFSEVCRNSHSH